MSSTLFRRSRRLIGLSGLLAVVLLVAACGSGTPSASPTSSAVPPTVTPSLSVDAIYDAIEAQVSDIRGLQASRPVERQFITSDELRTMLTEQLDEDAPPAYVAATERLYKALGLIPADASLRELTLDLLGGGVIGFYRQDQGKLYVLSKSGAPGGNERFTFAHEYDHALQDQNFTVFKDQDGVLDQSDRILARQAIYEGDATLLMTQWAAGNLTPEQLLEIVSAATDPEVAAVLARTPAILRVPLEFPYTTGLGFAQGLSASGGWPAIDAAYARMPESTEQILHPEKYRSAEAPVKVALPADLAARLGAGWTIPLQDTFGELQIGIWLHEGGVETTAANAAAAGWGGDRLAVLDGPGESWAVVMNTAWDTEADAEAFEAAATTALGKAGGEARVLPGAGGTTRWVVVANDARTLGQVSGALGLAD